MTARSTHPQSDRLTVALRREQDCWEALTTHTANCAACLTARRHHNINGFGCDVGHERRDQWLAAARKRYELSPQHQSSQAMVRAVQHSGDEECD